MVLNNSEIASNRPWTSMLIFWGIPELIVLTLVTSLALTNMYIYIPLRACKSGSYTSAERKYYNRIINQINCKSFMLLTLSY